MRPGKRRRRSDKDNIPPGIRKLPSPPTTLEQAQMEWDLVETVQPGRLAKCNITGIQLLNTSQDLIYNPIHGNETSLFFFTRKIES